MEKFISFKVENYPHAFFNQEELAALFKLCNILLCGLVKSSLLINHGLIPLCAFQLTKKPLNLETCIMMISVNFLLQENETLTR